MSGLTELILFEQKYDVAYFTLDVILQLFSVRIQIYTVKMRWITCGRIAVQNMVIYTEMFYRQCTFFKGTDPRKSIIFSRKKKDYIKWQPVAYKRGPTEKICL